MTQPMRGGLFITFAVAVAATMSAPADAQNFQRKPGLWEIEYGGRGEGSSEMEQKMAKMTPEERARMQEMMKQRGVGMTLGPDGPMMHLRVCVTSDDIQEERDLLRTLRGHSECKTNVLTRSAAELHVVAACRNAEGGTSELDGRIHDLSAVTYAVDWTGRSPTKGEFELRQKGRWIGADCAGAK